MLFRDPLDLMVPAHTKIPSVRIYQLALVIISLGTVLDSCRPYIFAHRS